MDQATKYWTIQLLDNTGKARPRELPTVKTFLKTHYPTYLDPSSSDEILVRLLLADPRPEAQFALRCLISQHILIACQSLVNQFGQHYSFTLIDLLPLVLDDTSKPWHPNPTYKPLSQRALDRFNPDIASLNTWINRLVRQHRDINTLLLDRGLYLISDWAILNDTKPDHLYRIWTQDYSLSPQEAEQACCLLESFRRVYTPEHKPGSRCKDPSADQIDRITQAYAKAIARPISQIEMQQHLSQLCQRLRSHRIRRRGGQIRNLSVEDAATLERLQDKFTHDRTAELGEQPEDHRYDHLLATCHQIFDASLKNAIHTAITQAHNQFLTSTRRDTRAKAALYFPALRLFHGDRISMGDIAPRLGLKRQDDVSRLLNLNRLRTQVRDLVITQCLTDIKPLFQTQGGFTCAHLDRAIAHIEALFAQQIDPILQEEEQRTRTPKAFDRPTQFTQALCDQLDALGA